MKSIHCFNCKGNMIETKTHISAGWGEYELTINGVKGFVCSKCGAKMYAPEEIEMVEKISKSIAESKMPDKPTYLNVEETADLLRVTPQTVYNMIKSERIQAIKFGREWRFLRKNIESLMSDGLALAARDASEESVGQDQDIIVKIRKELKDDE